jgi:hypothetical protein
MGVFNEQKMNERAWEDAEFKKQLLANPRAALEKETGQKLPANIQFKVIEDTADTVHLALRRNPGQVSVSGELSEEALEAVAGGLWALIVGDKGSRYILFGW